VRSRHDEKGANQVSGIPYCLGRVFLLWRKRHDCDAAIDEIEQKRKSPTDVLATYAVYGLNDEHTSALNRAAIDEPEEVTQCTEFVVLPVERRDAKIVEAVF